jgi:predicted transcriptional regulator of viral defense system
MVRTTDTLFTLADEHGGVFTAAEAVAAGISPQHLVMLALRGVLETSVRGIYRLQNYPSNQEDVQLWEAVLWPSVQRSSESRGVLSHLTALRLNYAPFEYVPPFVDITVSPDVRLRRKLPAWLRVHVAELGNRDVTDIRGLPVTTIRRSLLDCIAAGVERRLLLPVLDAAAKEAELLYPEDVAQLREAIG